MKKALFVTYGGGHVSMVIAVLKELERRGGWATTVLGLTTAKARLDAAGIGSLGFKDLVLPEDRDALQLGEMLARANHTEGVGISMEESSAYLGLSYADLAARVGKEEAAQRYRNRGRAAFLPLGPVERLFRRVAPDVVVTTSSPRAEKAAIDLAKASGIPSLCMIDFVLPDMLVPDSITPFLTDTDYADRITVFSDALRTRFIELGRRPGDVVVTGNPAFDRLADPNLPEAALTWRRERGIEGKKVILWASQPEPPNPELPANVLRTLLDALPSHPDWQIVYRRHPSEAFLPIALPPGAIRSDTAEDLGVVLAASDVVITFTSTVGLEAVLMGKPLVKVCLSFWDAFMPYEKMGVALGVHRLEDLPRMLELALGDTPEAAAMVEARHRYPRPGSATGRVADQVEDLGRASRR